MTTLQAMGVIIVAVVVAGYLPRVSLGRGFGLNPGNGLIALGLAVAAFSPKRVSKRQSKDEADE
jgi:type IV secretory pathway TrbL component